MIEIMTWAVRWGVPLEAVRELQHSIGIYPEPGAVPRLDGRSEAAVSAAVTLAAAERGGRLWRNNNGAYQDQSGRWVRYGLCNDSAKLNEVCKSSDRIGIYPRVITPEDVGHTIGQFDAVEVKEVGWTYTGTPREVAQLNFGAMVLRLGGRFRFENGSTL